MKTNIALLLSIVISVQTLYASDTGVFDTKWIPSNPEVLTYKSTSKQGDGLYQVSLSRGDSTIEIYINIITNGFTKTVTGTMTFDMIPIRSTGKIIVNGQITMDTKCSYDPDRLHIATLLSPYKHLAKKDLPFKNLVIDFSQVPLLARTLQLKVGAEYTFDSLDPQKNAIVPFTLKVVGESRIKNTDCYKVEDTTFEGKSTFWIEKSGQHRVLRMEQLETNRVTELLESLP